MTDLQTETAALPSLAQGQGAAGPLQMFRAFGFSFVVNGLCPYLLYTYLAPHFPKGAVEPLLYASVFPVLGLVFGIVRKRMVDMIALIALIEISINIAAIFLTPSIKWALVARSLTGLGTGSIFLVSAIVGRPIVYYIARQFVTGGDPARAQGFDAVNKLDRMRTFTITTLVWAFGIYGLSALNAGLALNLAPQNYLLVSQFTGMTVNIALIVWSIRFSRTRLLRHLAPAAAASA